MYYGLSQSTGSLGVDFYLSFFISGAIEVPAYIYIWIALDRIGRKPNLSVPYIIGGIACIVAIFLRKSYASDVVSQSLSHINQNRSFKLKIGTIVNDSNTSALKMTTMGR